LVPTRWIYRVAPGGQWLAYEGPRGLHLHPAVGSELIVEQPRDFAFSPDGRWLAVVTAVPGDGSERSDLVLIDLTSRARRNLGHLHAFFGMAWTTLGVVIKQHTVHRVFVRPAYDALTYVLTLFPLSGVPRHIYWDDTASSNFEFATAARGHRVLVFGHETREVDLDDPIQPPRTLAGARGFDHVGNAEMAADGSVALFAADDRWSGVPNDASGLFFVDGTSTRRIGDRVDDLWFADDGSALLWSADGRAYFGDRDGWKELSLGSAAAKAINSVRFRRDARGLILVAENRVLALEPGHDQPRLLYAHPAAQERVLVAESFAGGIVIWKRVADTPPTTSRR
jgi:hypothetical protein